MSGWWTAAVTLIYVIMASPAAEADALGTAPINATLFNLQTMYNEVSTLGTIFLDVDVCVKGKSGLPLSDYIAWGASDDITHANWHMLKARMSAQGLQLLTVQPDNTRAVRHHPERTTPRSAILSCRATCRANKCWQPWRPHRIRRTWSS